MLCQQDGCAGDAAVPVPKNRPSDPEVVASLAAALAQGSLCACRSGRIGEGPATVRTAVRRHALQRSPTSPAQIAHVLEIQGMVTGAAGRGEDDVQAGGGNLVEPEPAQGRISG